jgi:predicted DsbA family dithiol-disulfide isomerase
VRVAHQLAILNERIRAEAVASEEFGDWAESYGVSSVPHVVINEGKEQFVGALPESEFVQYILKAVA